MRRVALVVLLLAYVAALLPDFFSPYRPSRQHRDYPYAAPGIYGGGQLRLLVRGESYRLLGVVPASLRLFGTDGHGFVFLLGSDEFGRDVYSRLCHGASTSLLLAPAAALFSLILALGLGSVAGYYGGWPDIAVTRAGEILLALPWFYFVVALRAALPLNLSAAAALLTLFTLLGLLGWALPARVFRGIVRGLRVRDFVIASRSQGARDLRIFWFHLVPFLLPAARTQLLVSLPAYIITEVSLSFLGLGVVEPTPTWGNMLTPLQQYVVLTSYPWMLAPVVAIVLVFLSLNTLAQDSAHREGVAK
ncbi:MAG TPA: ABC transporter permease [Acidobacteriota bacterium]